MIRSGRIRVISMLSNLHPGILPRRLLRRVPSLRPHSQTLVPLASILILPPFKTLRYFRLIIGLEVANTKKSSETLLLICDPSVYSFYKYIYPITRIHLHSSSARTICNVTIFVAASPVSILHPLLHSHIIIWTHHWFSRCILLLTIYSRMGHQIISSVSI